MIQANVSLDFTQELVDVCSLHKYCTIVF